MYHYLYLSLFIFLSLFQSIHLYIFHLSPPIHLFLVNNITTQAYTCSSIYFPVSLISKLYFQCYIFKSLSCQSKFTGLEKRTYSYNLRILTFNIQESLFIKHLSISLYLSPFIHLSIKLYLNIYLNPSVYILSICIHFIYLSTRLFLAFCLITPAYISHLNISLLICYLSKLSICNDNL